MTDKKAEPDPLPMTRRRFLGAAAGTAAAGALYLMPPNLRRAMAQTPARLGSLRDIKHVVPLMQENRSFGHYFGTLAAVRGFNDPHALVQSNGKSIFYQPYAANPLGYLLPFHLDTLTSSAQKIPSNSHTWEAQHASWNLGKMDHWMSTKAKTRSGPCQGKSVGDGVRRGNQATANARSVW